MGPTFYIVLIFACPSIYLALHGLNLYGLTAIYWRHRRQPPHPGPLDSIHHFPPVCTQIPVYNECNVIERSLRAATAMRYPGRHVVQVLDDSTDATRELIDRLVAELSDSGHEIQVVRREDRSGFKAGALRRGMEVLPMDYYAIFDADFVPPEDFLERGMPILLRESTAGFLQCRWGHLNETASWLTRCVSIGMDGHFAVEQEARYRGGMFLNFNGTAGIWRRRAIEDAGGWSADTLTEDMDLSYRAQLAGWKPLFDGSICVPAEVPEDMNAFKQQQFRWAKGSIQTARKLLPRIWRSPLSLRVKVEATFHLTHYSIHPVMIWMVLAAWPGLVWFPRGVLPLGALYLGMMIIACAAPSILYAAALRRIHGTIGKRMRWLPVLSAVGVGLAANNSRAVLEALRGKPSAFVRTPKRGSHARKTYRAACHPSTCLEVGLGILSLFNLFLAIQQGYYWIAPFMLLYTTGFAFVSVQSIRDLVVHLVTPSAPVSNAVECEG